MTGPGWGSDRDYQAGDRVLLHARCGGAASRLVNGTTATVTHVDGDGLTVILDSGATVLLAADFVQGTRKDGSPNLSHAWARTVDGAQGGTWETCHLLGSGALDAYRGYTGQSRSRQPTHTWNTTRVAVVDHGGILADQRVGAEQVADALARQPDPSLAARSDPWTVDRQLRQQIAQHEQVLAGRPPDRQEALAAAVAERDRAQAWLANMDAIARHTARQLEELGRLAGLSRRGRDQRRSLEDQLAGDTERADTARHTYEEVAGRAAQLRRDQDTFEWFQAAEGWRRDDLTRLHEDLDHHWAQVVTACVRADDPLAFGIDKLRHARTTTLADLGRLDACHPGRPEHRMGPDPPAAPRSPQGTPRRRAEPSLSARLRSKRQGGGGGAATTSRRSPRPAPTLASPKSTSSERPRPNTPSVKSSTRCRSINSSVSRPSQPPAPSITNS